MLIHRAVTLSRLAAAACALGLVALSTHAAYGVSIHREQGRAVTPGMTPAEVQALLGRPANVTRYPGAVAPTWTYYIGESLGRANFDVDFGADGRVKAVQEYSRPFN